MGLGGGKPQSVGSGQEPRHPGFLLLQGETGALTDNLGLNFGLGIQAPSQELTEWIQMLQPVYVGSPNTHLTLPPACA